MSDFKNQKSGSFYKKLKHFMLPVIILAAGGGSLVVLMAMKKEPEQSQKLLAQAAPLVLTQPVIPTDSGFTVTVDGTVVPSREVKLAAEVAGRVLLTRNGCKVGNLVRKATDQERAASGTENLLIQIDPENYELEVKRLTQEHAQAQDVIDELEVEIDNSKAMIDLAHEEVNLQKTHLNRVEKLRARNVVSDTEFEEAKRGELAARNALQKLTNEADLLRSKRQRMMHARDLVGVQLSRAKLDLSRTRIYSPINGVIVEDSVEEDGYVKVGDPLVTIEDTSAVEVSTDLRMEELSLLWQHAAQAAQGNRTATDPSNRHDLGYQLPQLPVKVSYELGGRKFVWDGELSRFDGIGLDEKTRTVPCRIIVSDPRPSAILVNGQPTNRIVGAPPLTRGMFVVIDIPLKGNVSLLKLPEMAIRPGNLVWVVRDGKLHSETVRVVDMSGDQLLVEQGASGLKPGDRVVVSPLSTADEGMLVSEGDAE
ncbi:efflux RND transporter periplasmic adaptor subunit [Gimesia algae]|uniref:Multidrug resistance protein MdtN n=1 Tax=Gimesia algae TaxID=2527971 RepID=A0A517V9S5_9PLAN|nr:HlyD family efflux transporter periplasmic adaptor subunit [Gimesia algae]QDT89746.1 multidrug resistance protein MdtN [Gimesia algae]